MLEEQDRSRWDRDSIAAGVSLVRESLTARPLSRYALQAAIAAVHATAASWHDTDWGEIVGLYDVLTQSWPSPVVSLNRAVAVGFASGPAAGLTALDALPDDPRLAAYTYLPAARADLLRRLGRADEAAAAYAEALRLTDNVVERTFLEGRMRLVHGGRARLSIPPQQGREKEARQYCDTDEPEKQRQRVWCKVAGEESGAGALCERCEGLKPGEVANPLGEGV